MKLDKEKIREDYKNGFSYRELAKKYNCSKASINYHCCDIVRPLKLLTKEDVAEIKSLYKNGSSSTNISKKLNISLNTVHKYLKNELIIKPKQTNEEKIFKIKHYRIFVKNQCIAYKGGACQICGYNKCNRSLDFHHLNPKEKDFEISGGTRSFKSLKKELDKCILVCRNCHGEIHEKLDLGVSSND